MVYWPHANVPAWGERSASGGGDETNEHQQTDDFPVACHKTEYLS